MKMNQTKRILRIIFIIASIGSLYFVPWILVKAYILPLPDTVQEQLNEATGLGFDGMIVYVAEAGKPPDRKSKIPANPRALFKIASISKLYVAVAVAKLVNDKQLSLDKTLTDYFPDLVGRIEHADKITLRMMVQHRSGIPDFTAPLAIGKAHRQPTERILSWCWISLPTLNLMKNISIRIRIIC
jgi:CubicO group peptidase (beta-lactamase class C family)